MMHGQRSIKTEGMFYAQYFLHVPNNVWR